MNNKREVFIILTPGFAAAESDTACLPMQQAFVKTVSRLYPEIEILVLSFQYPFRKQMYKWHDVTVNSFNGRNRGGLSRLYLRRKVNKALMKIHKDKKIVGMLSFWLGECAYVGKKFAERNHITHYCWLLGQDAKEKNKYPARIAVKGDELIALSDFLQEEFHRNYGIKPFKVIPPGIEERFAVETARDIDLLAVGSLIPLKQFDIFIETVAAIRKLLPNVKAVLVGEGPEKNKMKSRIAELSLEQHVTLAGELPHPVVLDLMRRTKLLLHPSSYEGFGVVCLEALSAGAHVISFCRVMKTNINQWHIVNSRDEMIEKALQILKIETAFNPIWFQTMTEVSKKMMNLYLEKTDD